MHHAPARPLQNRRLFTIIAATSSDDLMIYEKDGLLGVGVSLGGGGESGVSVGVGVLAAWYNAQVAARGSSSERRRATLDAVKGMGVFEWCRGGGGGGTTWVCDCGMGWGYKLGVPGGLGGWAALDAGGAGWVCIIKRGKGMHGLKKRALLRILWMKIGVGRVNELMARIERSIRIRVVSFEVGDGKSEICISRI